MLMKALSVRQPWTHCILHLGKDYENRSWSTKFRGKVLLHASKGMTWEEYEECLAIVRLVGEIRPFPSGTCFPAFRFLQRGGVVGVVDIVSCTTAMDSPWRFGNYGYGLANAREVPFFPCKGQLGFFEVDYPFELPS